MLGREQNFVGEFDGKRKQQVQASNGWTCLDYARQVGNRIGGCSGFPQDQLLQFTGLLTEKGKDGGSLETAI
jgi:hypothetical protein